MAEADINKILCYIKEREATLSRYSDKLRQNLQEIFNIFGDSPKIHISLDLTDVEHFAKIEPEPEYYYLATKKGRLVIMGTVAETETEWACWYQQPREVSREVLKQLVRSGRLILFLQRIVDVLTQENKEYKQVAEVAEKMAQAIKA